MPESILSTTTAILFRSEYTPLYAAATVSLLVGPPPAVYPTLVMKP